MMKTEIDIQLPMRLMRERFIPGVRVWWFTGYEYVPAEIQGKTLVDGNEKLFLLIDPQHKPSAIDLARCGSWYMVDADEMDVSLRAAPPSIPPFEKNTNGGKKRRARLNDGSENY